MDKRAPYRNEVTTVILSRPLDGALSSSSLDKRCHCCSRFIYLYKYLFFIIYVAPTTLNRLIESGWMETKKEERTTYIKELNGIYKNWLR